MKKLIITLLSLIAFSTSADSRGFSSYYEGTDLETKRNEELKLALKSLISDQTVLSYKEARRFLFGDLYLQKNGDQYFITDAYCEKDFTSSVGVGPGRIPNHNQINCEHSWPQSRFSRDHSSSAQKSDLHHLYPTMARANSTRRSVPFGEVDGHPVGGCPASLLGQDVEGSYEAFEPSKYHKGNVARALFYFAVRYDLDIDETEEFHLRAWHKLDPVDQDELARHEKIYQKQGNRNPFIDDESLIDRISDI